MAMDMTVGMRIAASVSGGSSIDDLRKSVEKLNGSANGIGTAFSKAGTLLKGFIGIEAVRRVADYGMELIKMGDRLDELSERTGVAATTLSSLSKTAQQSGVSLDDVATGMKKLSVNMVEAQNGSKEAARGFAALKLDPRSFKTSEEALYAIADRFKNMEDGANKVAIAQALMGKSGEANIPWLNMGAEAMRKYGSTFSQEFISMSAKFTDLLDEIGFKSKKSAASIVEKFLPTMSEIVSVFAQAEKSGSGMQFIFDALNETFRMIAASVQVALTGIKQFLEMVSTAIDLSKMMLQGNVSGIGERMRAGYEEILKVGAEGNAKVEALMKNSLIFGKGTVEEIRQRQIDAAGGNDKKDPAKKTFNADMSSFNKQKDPESEKIEKFIIAQDAANQKRLDELDAVNMSTLAYQQLTAIRDINTKSAELAVGMTDAGKKKLAEATETIKAQTEATIQLKYETERTFEYGAKQAFKTYLEDIGNMAKQSQELFTKAFKGMEDALVNFVMTGKLDFKSLANSIISDMARIAIRQAIMKPLLSSFGVGSMFGFANGGVMTSEGAMPLKKYANGGIASTPQLAMFGEGSMPEAYVPLPDGRNIPVKMQGGSGGNNNVTVNVSVEGGNSKVTSDTSNAAMLGNAITKAVQNELMKQKRPGGLLYG